MAQRHVLMMLAAAANSFLEGEPDRAESGPAKAIGIDLDWGPGTRTNASIRKPGVQKAAVAARVTYKLAVENAG